jgi:hypothetical protein
MQLAACAPAERRLHSAAITVDSPYAHPRGANAVIRFATHADGAYEVRRLVVVLDGAVIYQRAVDHDEASLGFAPWARKSSFPVYDGPLEPGDHYLQVLVAASLACGIAAAPRSQIELRSAHSFTVGTVGARAVDFAVRFYTTGPLAGFVERVALDYVDLADRGAKMINPLGATRIAGCDDFEDAQPSGWPEPID